MSMSSSIRSAAAPPPSLASSDYHRSEGVDSPPPLTEDDDGSDSDSMGGHDDEIDDDVHPKQRSVSPAASAYSYTSSVDSEFMLRDLHGRTLNNTNANYLLPADAVEHGRLDLQHEMLKRKMNGIFVRGDAVRRAMAPRQGAPPAALDIGTGSGSWAIDMGRLFPHAEIVGLDLAPAILSRTPPSNCRFECDDVNLGLSHYKNSFDVVHMRCVTSGLEDYRTTLLEVADIMRPGGVYLMMEGNLTTYNENFEQMHIGDEKAPGFSFYSKMANAVLTAVKTKRPNIDSFHSVPKWLKEMNNVWEESGEKNFFIPIGPWEENMTDKQRYISELMRQDILKVASSFRPLLLAHGYFPETVDRWIYKTQDELLNLKVHMYIKWHCCWSIKKRTPMNC